MATVKLVEYEDASSEVREIYDDIRAHRKTDFINNFWKGLANNPAQLRRTWMGIKEVMGAGALDPLTKELIYIAVSVANNCEYCIHSTLSNLSRSNGHRLLGTRTTTYIRRIALN